MDKTIKAIYMKRFSVELSETSSGKYVILYRNSFTEGVNYSEIISDYNTASYLFDLKVQDLDGQ
jgi:hypothetical protein